MQTRCLLLVLPVLLLAAPPACAAGDARVAALQVALRARGFYAGTIDGVPGPQTARAVRRLQRRKHLAVDGVAGARTLRVLRRHELGSRQLHRGSSGWDVAELQFALAWHGFPSGGFDGTLGGHTARALRGFQRWAGLHADGVAGPATAAALRAPAPHAPIRLAWPLQAALGDRFGPRGSRFHAGIDLPAPTGTGVAAAAAGRVAFAGELGGWGLIVILTHRNGVRTLYAHLSRIDVVPGRAVEGGWQIGRVGATGHATGPHLHFEVRVRGAIVDPLSALP